MYTTLLYQYQLVLSSRKALFAYCETINPDHLAQPLPAFNHSSMLMQLLHNANTYVSWLANFALQQQRPFFADAEYSELPAIEQVFGQMDQLMNEFLHHFNNKFDVPLTLPKKEGLLLTLTPLQLFTHVITHEFHHKGQLLNMSRQLGYIPVDTDVIRT